MGSNLEGTLATVRSTISKLSAANARQDKALAEERNRTRKELRRKELRKRYERDLALLEETSS